MNTSTRNHVHHTCVHTQIGLCAPFRLQLTQGLHDELRLCMAAATRKAAGQTNKQAMASVWNSGGRVVYPAAQWHLIKNHA